MRAFLFFATALAAAVCPGVTTVTHREATNIAETVLSDWRTGETVVVGWKSSASKPSVAVGNGAQAKVQGTAVGYQVVATNLATGVGVKAKAEGYRSVAIGYAAKAEGSESVQLGEGRNRTAGTLQFMGWQLVGSDGKIPSARLPAVVTDESDPLFSSWTNGEHVAVGRHAGVGYPTTVSVGPGSCASHDNAVAIGSGARAEGIDSVQIGLGTNTCNGTLQYRQFRLVGVDGKIPAERLPQITAEESDPVFTGCLEDERTRLGHDAWASPGSTVVGASAFGDLEGTAVGYHANAGMGSCAIGKGAVGVGMNCVQLGTGENTEDGTLQFRSWQLVDAEGQIPPDRLEMALCGYMPLSAGTNDVQVGSLKLVSQPIRAAGGGASLPRQGVRKSYLDMKVVAAGAGMNVTPVATVGTDADWAFGGKVAISGELVIVNRAGEQTLTEFVDESITFVVTPTYVLDAIKAMTDAQKAELKAALGI